MQKNESKPALQTVLAAIGFFPVGQPRNGRLWYKSPLRVQERTASFCVDLLRNRWADYGCEGNSGDVYDFLRQYYKISFPDAVKLALTFSPLKGINEPLAATPSVVSVEPPSTPTVRSVEPLRNYFLLDYLVRRSLKLEVCNLYLRQVAVNFGQGKEDVLFVGFQNDLKGWELSRPRTDGPNWKICAGRKAVTTLPRLDQAGFENENRLCVYESWSDFLSAQVFFKQQRLKFTSVILNSTALTNQIIPKLRDYWKVDCFLDNDDSGKKAFEKIKSHRQDAINWSAKIYPESKDFNDYLQSVL